MTGKWAPIDRLTLANLVDRQLEDCSYEQRSLFQEHRVDFYPVPIQRLDAIEQVYVVEVFGHELLFYENVEGGFELARLDENKTISSYGASKFELCHVLEHLRVRSISGEL